MREFIRQSKLFLNRLVLIGKLKRTYVSLRIGAPAWGTIIAQTSHGSVTFAVGFRNLFCSEQTAGCRTKAEDGREDGGPAFHSKHSHEWRAAALASEAKQYFEKLQTVHSSKMQRHKGAWLCTKNLSSRR